MLIRLLVRWRDNETGEVIDVNPNVAAVLVRRKLAEYAVETTAIRRASEKQVINPHRKFKH